MPSVGHDSSTRGGRRRRRRARGSRRPPTTCAPGAAPPRARPRRRRGCRPRRPAPGSDVVRGLETPGQVHDGVGTVDDRGKRALGLLRGEVEAAPRRRVVGRLRAGGRRQTPTRSWPAPARRRSRAVPTLPLAPVMTIRTRPIAPSAHPQPSPSLCLTDGGAAPGNLRVDGAVARLVQQRTHNPSGRGFEPHPPHRLTRDSLVLAKCPMPTVYAVCMRKCGRRGTRAAAASAASAATSL